MSEEILNKYIELINKNYCSDCNELNCIDNFPHKKIANAIRDLQQENQQLKEKYLNAVADYETTKSENQQLKENNQSYQEEMCRSWEKVDKYKSALDEIREYIKGWQDFPHTNGSTHRELRNLMEILDKVKE